jgi:dTDP-4-amino-4,6-dideoxygalactose transaminase
MFRIPLTQTTLGEEEAEAAARVVRSKWLTMGEEVAAFEREFAAAVGSRHAVAVANGTVALEIAYQVGGLRAGDEIILPSITFIACLNAARRIGARAVLADVVSEHDLTLCPRDTARKITPRTRMIVPMAHGGNPPDMAALVELANEHRIPIVEDACHGLLSEVAGRRIGTFGTAGTWSFFGNKNMTTGEGGMITTDVDDVASRARLIRSHGITKTTWDRVRGHAFDYDVAEPGTNARMDEIRAAIGRVQLAKVPAANAARAAAAARLRTALGARRVPGLVIPENPSRGISSHHLFCVLIPHAANRRAVMEKMAAAGVQTSIHYPALHTFESTRAYFAAEGAAEHLPVTDAIAGRILTLPLGPQSPPEEAEEVAAALATALGVE